jgi:5-methylphenazine-1-carboxylate 1-monooxygenase
MDIAIVGGGIGGLTLALALHKENVPAKIRIYEAAPEFKPLGVGINLMPHAMKVLTELGTLDALAKVGVEPKEFMFFTHHGQFVYREPTGYAAGFKYPHYSFHRADLHQVLYEAVIERLGRDVILMNHRCVRSEEGGDRVTLHFVDANGKEQKSHQADIAIGCDGIHSALRKQFYPNEGPPVFHGINIWRGVTRAKPFLTGGSVTRVGGLYTTSKLGIYPIRNNIDDEGNQLINWFAEVVTDVQYPVDWHKAGRMEDFYPIYKDWSFDWLDCAALIRNSDFILTYPMVDRDPVTRWTFGRVTLLGDAAHPMYPRGGNGGAQSIIDAVTLAELLKNTKDPVEALKTYDTTRIPTTSQIVMKSRTAPPDLIIDTVEKHTGGKRFENLDDIISQDELREIAQGYYRTAGQDLDTVGRRAS